MNERRAEPRMLCADMVDVAWRDKSGRMQHVVANLEDISQSGACLQTDVAIPLQAELEIAHPSGEFRGTVRYCVYRDIGYFVGVEFQAGIHWDSDEFQPQHLLDPRRLEERKNNREGQ